MKLKIAAMLIASIFMSANTSYGGDLLDRLLGRSGCSSCAAPAVKSCGCGGGGLLDKLMSCGKSQCSSAGILNVDSSGGCGCEAAAPSCGCEAAPAVESSCGCNAAPMVESSCGCDAAPMVESSCGCDAAPMVESSCGCDAAPAVEASSCGCEAAAPSCGCEAAPVIEASPCGCDAAPARESAGLFTRLRAMGSGCGCSSAPAAEASSCGCGAAPAAQASPCGCDAAPGFQASPCGSDAAPAVAASPCGFEASPAMADPFSTDVAPAAPSCGLGGGFLSRLRGMGKGLSCNSAAPVAEASACGCDAAPAVGASCGCDAAPVVSSGCGCDAAPGVSTCGCNAAPSAGCRSGGGLIPGGGRPKLTLLDRLRGNRIPRDRDGRVLGVCNDGCNPPCPVQPSSCGSAGHVEAPYVEEAAPCSSCSTCGGGEVIYSDAVPTEGCANGVCGSTPVYGEAVALPAAAAASEGSGSRVDPVVPATTEGTLQDVEPIESGNATQPSISDEENDPIVDPGAFISRPTTTMGS